MLKQPFPITNFMKYLTGQSNVLKLPLAHLCYQKKTRIHECQYLYHSVLLSVDTNYNSYITPRSPMDTLANNKSALSCRLVVIKLWATPTSGFTGN